MSNSRRDVARAPLVLIVDDIDDNRDLYAAYLVHQGFRVDDASHGHAALAKVEVEIPDAIVMDLAMPGLDGWETTRRIKADPRTANVVVVVVTGHATEEELARARAMGADEVCTKPCLPSDLVAMIRRLLTVKARV